MKTIIIGVGNPILTDDCAGVTVARMMHERLRGRTDIEAVTLSAGGIRLLDAMTGYDRAIIIDAMAPASGPAGTLRRLSLDDLGGTWNTASIHDMNLPTAIAVGRMLGMSLPGQVDIWGIEGKDLETFGEEPTPGVATAILRLVDMLCQELQLPIECPIREVL
jgi:hydrogenase maturation protease